MNFYYQTHRVGHLINATPTAYASISGNSSHPDISGYANFYTIGGGMIVEIEVTGLPHSDYTCSIPFFGMHIHENDAHYNPDNCPHPAHRGDLPPLLGNQGLGWMAFYTNRFTPKELAGKTIVIHKNRDDFSSQPSGDAGERIASGIIY